jgi:hypothetical protein
LSHITLEELTAQRNALLAARFRDVRTVEIEGRRVTFATDAEKAAVITDLERRIAAAQDGGRKRRILMSASKGL